MPPIARGRRYAARLPPEPLAAQQGQRYPADPPMQASSAYRATSLETPRAGGDTEPGDTLGDASAASTTASTAPSSPSSTPACAR